MQRVILDSAPFSDDSVECFSRGRWPVSWIDYPGRTADTPSVAMFRLPITVTTADTVRIHVSADNRYRLFLDGQQIGRGPERGSESSWFYESYDISLTPGEHILLAQSWYLAEKAAFAQHENLPGFLLAAEGDWLERLSTGVAPWEAAMFPGIAALDSSFAWGTGAKVQVDGTLYPWGWETGTVGEWVASRVIAGAVSSKIMEYHKGCFLTPATLPPMREELMHVGRARYVTMNSAASYPVDAAQHCREEEQNWQVLLTGKGSLSIPAHTRLVAVVDLENYYCAYPQLQVSGGKGALLRVSWAEGLYAEADEKSLSNKGNRNEIDGKYFYGVGDEFLPDGGEHRKFSTLWWEAGRYVEIIITTADEPVTVEDFSLLVTGYPLTMEGNFVADDPRFAKLIPIAVRALQMCSHETYMDCPYYEQLMYVGDTRLEVLTTYAITHDDRLPRKAINMFDLSRQNSGLTQSRFPSRITQIIPPFSLWWTAMVYDYWLWRNDSTFVEKMLPGVRGVLEAFRALLNKDGLLTAPSGWNFMDWVPGWKSGIPPEGNDGISGVINMQFALCLRQQAEIEESYGEALLAARNRQLAENLMAAVLRHFWCEERGLIADDLAKKHFSEHTQCLAILSGLLDAATQARISESLLSDPNLALTTIYFTHYLFETLYKLNRPDKLLERLTLWFTLEEQGFKTTFEHPEPSRSDCHAWGAHPIYHYYASILGIRPVSAGFQHVRIAPQLGILRNVTGVLPHPNGEIRVAILRQDNELHATISLPKGIDGVFDWQGKQIKLVSGEQEFSI